MASPAFAFDPVSGEALTVNPGTSGTDVVYSSITGDAIPDPSAIGTAASGGDWLTNGFSGSNPAGNVNLPADPMGGTTVLTGPTNPNNNGGWENALASVLSSAQKAMTTYVAGSPQVAIPPVRRPANLTSAQLSSLGLPAGVNWTVVGIAIGVGVGALVLLGYFA